MMFLALECMIWVGKMRVYQLSRCRNEAEKDALRYSWELDERRNAIYAQASRTFWGHTLTGAALGTAIVIAGALS